MKAAVMQPYFLPYIGYFQLLASVDVFVVYDNIKYTKKGWINRNRLLHDGHDVTISVPLKHDSDSLDICRRELAADFRPERLLHQVVGAYRAAPYFCQTYPTVEEIVRCDARNLFDYLHHSLVAMSACLGIGTTIVRSSEIAADHDLKGQDRVLSICRALGAETYVNAIGGIALYAKDDFRREGVDLRFLSSAPFEYAQFGAAFVPSLSIVDALMFNPLDELRQRVATGYELV